jgi:hypothetical protein
VLTHGSAVCAPRGGPSSYALLQLGSTLRSAAGPLAQALQFARLRKEQQRKDRNPDQRGKRRDRPDLGERA